jgi:hypothetical protein
VKLVRNKHFFSSTDIKEQDHDPTIFFQVLQGASWWVPRDSNDILPQHTRRLVGEIHVSPSLKAAFTLPDCRFFVRDPLTLQGFPLFTICQYTVILLAPTVTGFELSPGSAKGGNSKRLALRCQEVEIATVYAEGNVRPIPVTSAAYDRAQTWPACDVLGKEPHSSVFTPLWDNFRELRRIQSLDLS